MIVVPTRKHTASCPIFPIFMVCLFVRPFFPSSLTAAGQRIQYVAGGGFGNEFVGVGRKQKASGNRLHRRRFNGSHVSVVILIPFFERQTGIARSLALRPGFGEWNHAARVVAELTLVEARGRNIPAKIGAE